MTIKVVFRFFKIYFVIVNKSRVFEFCRVRLRPANKTKQNPHTERSEGYLLYKSKPFILIQFLRNQMGKIRGTFSYIDLISSKLTFLPIGISKKTSHNL